MADDLIEYALVRVTREEIDRMYLDAEKAGALGVCGVPLFYSIEGGEITVYPQLLDGGRLDIRGDQVFYVPTPKAEPKVMPSVWGKAFDEAVRAVDAAQRKEHRLQWRNMDDATILPAGAPPPAPSIFNRIVSMVEFEGRLYVATERGVFVKDDYDKFVELEFEPFSSAADVKATHDAAKSRAADEAAGLVPLHPRQTAERADPFVPNKFGEH